jgi:hypothetical protein
MRRADGGSFFTRILVLTTGFSLFLRLFMSFQEQENESADQTENERLADGGKRIHEHKHSEKDGKNANAERIRLPRRLLHVSALAVFNRV